MEQPFFELLTTRAIPIAFIVLFIASTIEYVFPPFPGDTVFLFGAFLAAKDLLPISVVFIAGTLGSFAGSLAIYAFGKTKGRDYFLKKDFSFFSASKVKTLEDRFSRWGSAIIVVNRFAPGFRPFFFVAAGIAKMPFLKVAVMSLVSIILWNIGIFYLGYRMGLEWEKMKRFLGLYSNVIIVFITTIIVIYIVFLVVEARHNKKRTTDTKRK